MHEEHGNWADMSEEEQMYQEVVYDDLTGQILQYEHVVLKMGVWQTVPLSQCWERAGRKPIRGRWADANKKGQVESRSGADGVTPTRGDDICHNYRSRYGAQEVRQAYGGTNREGHSEAMPPIEALKLVISQAVTANNTGVINRKLLFMDVSKAYLHADVIDQELYVVLPKKIELVGQCGGLKKALNGTREAARCWKKTLECIQFISDRTSPCLFRQVARLCFFHPWR